MLSVEFFKYFNLFSYLYKPQLQNSPRLHTSKLLMSSDSTLSTMNFKYIWQQDRNTYRSITSLFSAALSSIPRYICCPDKIQKKHADDRCAFVFTVFKHTYVNKDAAFSFNFQITLQTSVMSIHVMDELSTSYSGGPGFKYRPRSRFSLRFVVTFLSSSRKMPGYLKFVYNPLISLLTNHSIILSQCCPTGDRRPLVTRPVKLLINLLLQADLFNYSEWFKKKIVIISSAALCTNATHATDFKTLPWDVCFRVKIVSDISCYRNKLKTIYNCIVICAHLNKINIWIYTMAMYHFWISIVKCSEY
jgi:hypothetical protein